MALIELSDAEVMGGLETLFRWVHVVAAMLWVGTAAVLAWVWVPAAADLDPRTERAATAVFLPRALFFLRFAALYAFAFGLALLFLLYYRSGDYFFRPLTELAGTRPTASVWIQPVIGILLGYGLYDRLFRTIGRRAPAVAGLLYVALATLFAGYLVEVLGASMRCTLVHVAALLGTAMVANTWHVVWPRLRCALEARAEGGTPAAADLELAAERGRHVVHMSVPVVLLMLGVHVSWLTGIEAWYLSVPAILLTGGAATAALFRKAGRLEDELPPTRFT